MENDDVNIRIRKSVHKVLKVKAARYGMSLKDFIGILSIVKIPAKIEFIKDTKGQ